VGIDEVLDSTLQVSDTSKDAAPHALVGEVAEEPLDHVQPGGAGGREMNVDVRTSLQPPFDFGVFVGRIVVADDVDLFSTWSALFDEPEEFEPLLVPVFVHALANDFPRGGVERGEQRSGAIALVVMGHGLAASFLERKSGLGPVEGLDLALLVTTENHGMFGWGEIESDNVLKLLFEVLVVGQFEGPVQMRLQSVARPDSSHSRFAHPGFGSHCRATPVRCPGWFVVEGHTDDFTLLGATDGFDAAWPGLVFGDTGQTSLGEAFAPASDLRRVDAQLARYFLIGQTFGSEKHDPRAEA